MNVPHAACLFVLILVAVTTIVIDARGAGECAMTCNDLRQEVLTLEICRDAKKTLPRPKVGDFCTTAMEQGFSDACVALCMEVPVSNRVAQACRAAAIEMPRPTVRKWCEHGYNSAFMKARYDLKSHFSAPRDLQEEAAAESETKSEDAKSAESETTSEKTSSDSEGEQDETSGKEILTTVPITLDDKTYDLNVYQGQNAEEAVVGFCKKNVSDDVGACIRQLLPLVLERIEALTNA